MSCQRDEELAELMSAAEALLFVSDEPVGAGKLAAVMEITPSLADEVLQALRDEYAEDNRGMQLREVAGGWRFYSHPAHHELIERYVLSWDTRKLSQAALEALAVVAYHQPVAKNGVNAVRGVNSDGVIASLVEKGLVREVGRDSAPGSPILYGTTAAFLEKFGLKSIKDLPPLEDFAPDEESRAFIRERLSGASPISDAADEALDDEQREQQERYVHVVDEDGRPAVEEVDSGDDVREDDPEAMAEIVAQAMTEKVGI
jgi:segregation and condensation protein B